METVVVEVTFRVKTQNVIIPNVMVEGLPLRKWSVSLWLLNSHGEEVSPDILSSCTYSLHPSFNSPVRKFKEPPFELVEKGWGGFELGILGKYVGSNETFKINHTLDLEDEAYEVDYTVEVPFQNRPALASHLKHHYPLPLRRQPVSKVTVGEGIDIDGLISDLLKVDEDVLEQVIQIMLSNTSVKQQVERTPKSQRFVVSLAQLPDNVLLQITKYITENR